MSKLIELKVYKITFLSLKIGSVWVALGCLCTFPPLHPAWWCAPPPSSVGLSVALEHVLWIMQREGGDLLPGYHHQNLQKYCKLKKFLWLFRWVFFKYLCSKILILILSKSNDTEVYVLNNNCYANATSLWFLHRNMGCLGGFSMGNRICFFPRQFNNIFNIFSSKTPFTSRSYQP